MTASFTPNIQLTEPARGDDVGTWDTPVNGNTTILDLILGGIATISLNNSNVVLSAAQFQSRNITFNSTLTGSVTVTFPTSFTKNYEIQHACTGSSAFTITLATTAGGQVISIPPGEIIDCFNDGTNIKFKNLGRIGEYWDYAGSSVPNWVSGCTVNPYINCAGIGFSSAVYPQLTTILGGTTTPDMRGRARFAIDQGSGRLTQVIAGSLFSAGGDQNFQQHSHSINVSDPGHQHGMSPQYLNFNGGTELGEVSGGSGSTFFEEPGTQFAQTGIAVSANANGSGGGQNLPPMMCSGLILIRAG
jgi:hypothetical protein